MGFTESLTYLSRCRLAHDSCQVKKSEALAGEDPHNPGQLDTHPLVREHFGEQLQSQRSEAWKECNRRLYNYYRALAPQFPDSFREMEPLFLAVICGCNAGLFREALHEVYIPRIQRGDVYFAANVLGARGALLLVLVHFFEHARWGSPVQTGVAEQSLTAEDQLFILTQAMLYLTATRAPAAPEIRICYELAEPLCHSLNRPLQLYVALVIHFRFSCRAEKLTAAMRIAERVCALAEEQNNPALKIGAYHILASTFYHLGDFQAARKYARSGIQIWRLGAVQSPVEDFETAAVCCLCLDAVLDWHFGEMDSCQARMTEAIALAKELNDMPGLAVALHSAALLGYCKRNPADVERFSSDLIELSARQNFAHWLVVGSIFRGWARSAFGNTKEGISLLEDGIRDSRATGVIIGLPFLLGMKAEALHLADRTFEALEALKEAEALVERYEERRWCAELLRLRGVFLTAMGASRPRLRLRSAKPLESHRSKIRFR